MEKLNLNLICDICNKKVDKIFKCSQCRKVKYCGQECQIKDWLDEHRQQCLNLKNNNLPTTKYVNRLMDCNLIKVLLSSFGLALDKTGLSLSITVIEKYNKKVNLWGSFVVFNIVTFPKEKMEMDFKPVLIKYLIYKKNKEYINLTCIANTVQCFSFAYDSNDNWEQAKNKSITKLNNTIFKAKVYDFKDFQQGRVYVILHNGNYKIEPIIKLYRWLALNKGESIKVDNINI